MTNPRISVKLVLKIKVELRITKPHWLTIKAAIFSLGQFVY